VLPPAFKQAFGIDLEVLVQPTAEFVTKLRLEQSTGQFSLDVIVSGANTMYSDIYPAKMFQPLKPKIFHPDAATPANWTIGKMWFMDPEEQYILRIANALTGWVAVNTSQVKPSELTSWQDLLKPQYKGKLSTFDPTINGAGGQHAAYLEYKLGPEYIKKLYVDQQPVKSQDNRQLSDWVGRGNYPLSIVMNAVNIEQLKSDGLPVKELPFFKEAPGYLTGGSGLMAEIKDPPHPNAAALFLNWMAIDRGQTVYDRAVQLISPRSSIKSDWAPEYVVPKPGMEYTDSYSWDYTFNVYPKAFETVRKILGAG